MIKISQKEARKIILQSQKLVGPRQRGGIVQEVENTIVDLGYIQIDTISVIERAHHHKLWTRVNGYQNAIIKQLEKKKRIFEYWSHAASYLPIGSYRFTLPVKEEIERSDRFWHDKDKKEMAFVLDRIKAEGELMSREFGERKKSGTSGPINWGPNKWALYHLFMEGRIMIVRREGFQKVYDLPERWLPDDANVSTPTRLEYIEFLIKRDIKAHGILKAGEMGYLLKGLKAEIKELLDGMEKVGSVVKLKIHGKGEEPYYMFPESIDLLNVKGYKKRLKILSPFDNAIINRKRTSEVFDFDYILECYVPQLKRKFGYFSLPILWDEQLIGQIDLKADRKARKLLVRNLELIEGFKKFDQVNGPLNEELKRMMLFNSCEEISVDCSENEFTRNLLIGA